MKYKFNALLHIHKPLLPQNCETNYARPHDIKSRTYPWMATHLLDKLTIKVCDTIKTLLRNCRRIFSMNDYTFGNPFKETVKLWDTYVNFLHFLCNSRVIRSVLSYYSVTQIYNVMNDCNAIILKCYYSEKRLNISTCNSSLS